MLALVALACTPSCGRKTAPRPPELVRPRTIDDLTARAVGRGILLTWTRPTTTVDGSPMPDLDGIVITRSTQPPSGTPKNRRIFEHLATIHLDDRGRFDKVRKMTYEDRAVVPGRVYLYRATAFTLDRYFSHPSPVARAEWTPQPALGTND